MMTSSASTSAPMSKGRMILSAILLMLILCNMAMISFFSSEPREASGDRSEGVTQTVVSVVVEEFEQLPQHEQQAKINEFHPIIRKIAHFSEFALLGCLCGAFMFALGRGKYWLCWVCPAAICLAYAIFDEVYQIFTNRGPAVTDVLIDFSGSLAGLVLIHLAMLAAREIQVKRRGAATCEPPRTA